MMNLLTESTKVTTLAEQSIETKEFAQQVASAKAAYDLVLATCPEPTLKSNTEFAKALEGWDLMIQFAAHCNEDDENTHFPMEPDVYGYKALLEYMGDRAFLATYSYHLGGYGTHPFGFAQKHEGTKYLPSKNNFQTMIELSRAHFDKGRAQLLETLQKN